MVTQDTPAQPPAPAPAEAPVRRRRAFVVRWVRRVLAIVVVKARTDVSAAGRAIGAAPRGRLARSAAQFLSARPDLAGLDLRYDAMLVTPWRWPLHLPDAWRQDTF